MARKHLAFVTVQTVEAERREKIFVSSMYGKVRPKPCRGGRHCFHGFRFRWER